MRTQRRRSVIRLRGPLTTEVTENLFKYSFHKIKTTVDIPKLVLRNGGISSSATYHSAVPFSCDLGSSMSSTTANLFEAALTGNLDKLEALLSIQETLDRLRDPGSNGFRDGQGRTPLHMASAYGHLQCVELLIQKGSSVNVFDFNENRATPLACAASFGSVPVVRVLLDGGADVNSGYEQGTTALHCAIQASSLECARVLLEAGAVQNPAQICGETALHVAASMGHTECLQLLLDYGDDVNLFQGINKSTSLHLSSEEGHAACVKLLLNAGASHAAKDIRGHTALHAAATSDSDCVIALLQAGANPNAIDANGRMPLHCAIAVAGGSGRTECLRVTECVRLLVESGADIDAQDNYGYTPLHLSAVNESSECASILLHHGSDVTLKTNAGITALSLLVRRIPEVRSYLLERLNFAVSIPEHDPADPDCQIRLDFRAILPNYEKIHGNEKSKGKGDIEKRQLSKRYMEMEFLNCLVGAGNKEILGHPLSEAFLTLKWYRVRKFFWASLLFHFALVAMFSYYVTEVYVRICPYRRENNGTSGEDIKETLNCDPSPCLQAIRAILVVLVSLMIFKEMFLLFQNPSSYLGSSEKWAQWLLIFTVIITAASTPQLQSDYLKYPIAACGIFFAWGLMLLQVGRFPLPGFYVQMFIKLAAKFGLVTLVYGCLLIGFALAFCVLLPRNPSKSSTTNMPIINVFTMMTGEVTYRDLFEKWLEDDESLVFPVTTCLLYGGSFLLMNILVGMAVIDIQDLQNGAKLNRLSRQIALLSRLESMLFSKKLHAILPQSVGSFLHRSALLIHSYNWSFYFRPNDIRDDRLPEDIKKACLLVAAPRHFDKKLKPSHSQISLQPHHLEVALPRMEQGLNHLQHHVEKAMRSLNGRLDTILELVKTPEGGSPTSHCPCFSTKPIHSFRSSMSPNSESDFDYDSVFLDIDQENTFVKESKGTSSQRSSTGGKSPFSTIASLF